MKYLYKGEFDLIVWVSPTFQLQQMTFDLPNGTGLVIIPEFRLEVITCLFQFMGSINLGKLEHEKKRALLIFDDIGVLGRKNKFADQLDKVACVARHYGISFLECTQRPTLLSPGLRSQMDCLLLFAEQNPQERTNLARSFGFGNTKEWLATFDEHTSEPFSFIGIRNIYGKNVFFDFNGEIPIVQKKQKTLLGKRKISDATTLDS